MCVRASTPGNRFKACAAHQKRRLNPGANSRALLREDERRLGIAETCFPGSAAQRGGGGWRVSPPPHRGDLCLAVTRAPANDDDIIDDVIGDVDVVDDVTMVMSR